MNKVFATLAPLGLVGTVLVFVLPARALSYVPMADAALLAKADVVAAGSIVAAGAVPGQELQTTQYALQAQQVIKGTVDAGAITVQVPGAFNPALDHAATVPGAPHFAVGDQVMLFLRRLDNGDYAITELTLGAFSVKTTMSGTSVLERDLSADDAACADCATEPARSHRELDRFSAWLRARTLGAAAEADYWSTEPLADLYFKPRFLTATPASRWFEFADGSSVPFYAGSTGQDGVVGGGYAELQQAILAWNTNSGSTIDYVFGGLSSASGGLSHADGVNEILFNDPNNELNGSFDCTNGGLLAYTVFRTSGSGQFNGNTFQRINEVDTVVRKGAGCFMTGNLNANAAELIAHEMGHTLGLAHPCGDPGKSPCVAGSPQDVALMRPTMHGDGRGASLMPDDQAGAAYLYAKSVSNGASSGDSTNPGRNGAAATASSGGGAWSLAALSMLLSLLGLRRLRHRGAAVPSHGR